MGRLGRQQQDILKLLLHRGGFARVRVLMSALFNWMGKSGNVKVFDQTHIGTEEYSLRHASLSRSLRRLREKGLLEVYKSTTRYVTAVGLTFAGVALARKMVNKEEAE